MSRCFPTTGLVVLVVLFQVASSIRAQAPSPVIVPAENKNLVQRFNEARKKVIEEKWTEAVEDYQRILDESANDLVPTGPDHAVAARRLCHIHLAALFSAGLHVYRGRVDVQARKWLESGISTRDEALLRRVVDEAFCSSSGAQALDLLGDWAFERGRFEEARYWWNMLAAPASATEQNPDARNLVLFFPDSPIDVARTRAKLILADLFQGERKRALAELEVFRSAHGQAEGSLAGHTGKYADILRSLTDPRDSRIALPEVEAWPTFGGDATRHSVVAGDLRSAERLLKLCRDGQEWRFRISDRTRIQSESSSVERLAGQNTSAAAARSLAFHPVIASHRALLADANTISAFDLRTGEASLLFDLKAKRAGLNLERKLPALSDVRYTLTVAGDFLLARMGVPRSGPQKKEEGATNDSFLVCLNLRAEKEGERLRWLVKPEAPNKAWFEGTPVVHEDRAYVAVTSRREAQTVTAIQCYPIHTSNAEPAPLWRREVCTSQDLDVRQTRTCHHLLTVAGSNVVYCTHSGAIVALDTLTGRLAWVLRYPSLGSTARSEDEPPGDMAPCVYACGRLFATPADSDRILCLDPASGRLLWQRNEIKIVHLLDAGHDRLIFTTPDGIRAVKAASGEDAGGWSEPADGTRLRSFGRGFLIGDQVVWPTSAGLHVLGQEDGIPVEPTQLRRIRAGNMAFADGCLVVAGTQDLTIYVPPSRVLPEREKQTQDNPRSATARYLLAVAVADAGRDAQALEDYQHAERLAGHDLRLKRLAQSHRHQLLMEMAGRAGAEQRWQEASGLLTRAAATEFPIHARLSALARQASVWTAARQLPRALEVWHSIQSDETLRAGRIMDAHGNPQPAATFASRQIQELKGLPRPTAPVAEHRPEVEIPPPELPLPLLRSWSAPLDLSERLLTSREQSVALCRLLFLACEEHLTCRAVDTGKECWKSSLGFSVDWIGGDANTVVVAGSKGIACLRLEDGKALWKLASADLEARYSDKVSAVLSAFRFSAGRLFFMQGQRRLFALDVATGWVWWSVWAPGGRCRLPYPGGRFFPCYHAGEHSLVIQTSGGKLWVLDSKTGSLIREAPTAREPWPQAPLALDPGHVCVVDDSQHISMLDCTTGKEVWKGTIEGVSTLSGEPPRLVGDSNTLLLLIARNYGYALQHLDPATGKERWSEERWISPHPVATESLAFDGKAVYFISAGVLHAHALADGKALWRLPFQHAGCDWRTQVTNSCLLAVPRETASPRLSFHWLSVAVAVELPPRKQAQQTVPIVLADAKSGQMIQRLNLSAGLSPARLRIVRSAGLAVIPQLRMDRRGAEACRMQLSSGGIVFALPGKVYAYSGK